MDSQTADIASVAATELRFHPVDRAQTCGEKTQYSGGMGYIGPQLSQAFYHWPASDRTSDRVETPMPRLTATLLLACSISTVAHAEEVRLGISSVGVADFSNMGGDAIAITLDAEGSRDFETFTANRIGKQVYVYLDDSLLLSPYIQSAIAGGDVQITAGDDGYGGMEQDELVSLLAETGFMIVSDTKR